MIGRVRRLGFARCGRIARRPAASRAAARAAARPRAAARTPGSSASAAGRSSRPRCGRGRSALDDEEGVEPDRDERRLRPRAPQQREHAGERDPLERPDRPEELAQRVDVVLEVLPVDVHVAPIPAASTPKASGIAERRERRRRCRRRRAGCCRARAASRARRAAVPGPARPRSRRAGASAARPGTQPAAPAKKIAFDGLTQKAKPTTSPASTASRQSRVSSARTTRYAATSSSTIDGKSRERRQPERLRQRLLDVLAVVALDEERDRDVRHRDPERRRPVAEDAARRSGRRSRTRRAARPAAGRAC